MRRSRLLGALLPVIVAALFVGAARAETFSVVDGAVPLPPATPNPSGQIVVPPSISTPPNRPRLLTYDELLGLWRSAGDAYGIPWEVLASINQIESDFGRNMGPSSAGAVGWMQFLPSSWDMYGVDANGDGIADPYNPTDAVYAAARYLAAAGAPGDLERAIFAYNHADWYVDDVLSGAARFALDPLTAAFFLSTADRGPSVEELQNELDAARTTVADLQDRLGALDAGIAERTRDLTAAEDRAEDPSLGDRAFARAEAGVQSAEEALGAAEAEIEATRSELADATDEVERLAQELALALADSGSTDLGFLLPDPPTEAAGRVVDYALSHLGLPYNWGGNHGFSLEDMVATDPYLGNGLDCSSLLSWSFAKGAGFYIGDWTVAQWEYGATAPGATRGAGPAQGGTAPPGGYLPGDIIFFNTTDHVALYIGNDLFVHAPRTGDVVKVSRLSGYKPVWGWVRYEQLSGIDTDSSLVEPERVFTVVDAGGADRNPVSFERQ